MANGGGWGYARCGALTAAVCAALGACAPAMRLRPPPAPLAEHATRHFTVACHYVCGAETAGALDAAEAAWALATQLFGEPARAPATPLPIHLYRTTEDYERAEERLTGGRFRLNRAMTHEATLSAHVLVHPLVEAGTLSSYGMPANTQRVIAHEALHLAARRIAPRTRGLPTWLDEGIAAWVETEVLVALGLASDRESEPVRSTRVHQLQQRMERGTLPRIRDLLAESGIDTLSLADRYAYYQLFYEHLQVSASAGRLAAELRDIGRAGARGDAGHATLTARLLGPLAADSAAAMDAQFRAWLSLQRVTWIESRRALAPSGEAWLHVGYELGGEAWRMTPVPAAPFDVTGAVRFLGDTREASLLLALDGGTHLAVTLGTDGVVTAVRNALRDDPEPVTLGQTRVSRSTNGTVAFRVRVEPDGVAIFVADAEPIRLYDAALRPLGPWGLAVPPAGNVVWLRVRAESLPP